jgi:Flp pilus assembly protein TadG
MHSVIKRFLQDRRGGAMLEFAVTLPILMLVSFGAADFGRLFLETSVIANASGAGAVYAARSTREASDLGGAESAVLANVNGLQSVAADVSKVCDCPAAPGAWISCSSTCSGYGLPRIYIRSKASKSFDTFTKYPGIPDHVDIGISTWLRVQ